MSNILKNISVVLPIHEINKETDLKFIKEAINSVFKDKNDVKPSNLTIVKTPASNLSETEITNLLDDPKNIEFIQFINNETNKTDYQSQINLFVETCQTDYFSILELDDQYSDIVFNNFDIYTKAYPKVSLFLPIIMESDNENKFQKFSSVEALTLGVSEINGIITHDALNKYSGFLLSGGLFKTSDYKAAGKLKSNIKISFLFEYLLRATHNGQIVMVIPKLGYLHKNGRPGSYLEKISEEGIDAQEVEFWYDVAKKEFFFLTDRNVSYKTVVVEDESR